MKTLYNKRLILLVVLFCSGLLAHSQGKLFIIGGGERSSDLIKSLVETSNFKSDDYIVILPIATGYPEESVAYISEQLSEYTKATVASFNFTKEQANENRNWIDSVKNARLIYITGGDQNKFMDVVRGTKLYESIHFAYKNGATISGTSAGAAVMSQVMITGEERGKPQTDSFREIKRNSAIVTDGLGLLKTAIIDQHFIMRSRYNRFFSVLADYPGKMMIGVDEGTAVVVMDNKVRVVGDSQVVVISDPKKMTVLKNGKVAFDNIRFSLYTNGQTFTLN